MKRIKFFAIAAAAIMVSMTSCNKENSGPEIETGEKTVIEVAVNFPKEMNSKATGDNNAIDAEAGIKTVDVFIFNSSGAYISHKALLASDFTAAAGGTNADKYTSTASIATTTGTKSVMIGINLPANTVTAVKGMSMSDMQTKTVTMTRAEATTITNGLPMFSIAPVTQNVVKDENNVANKFEVTVQRFVSKVIIDKSASMITAGVAGTLGTVEFAISNNNTKAFMIQTSDKKDPNWLDASYIASDFTNAPASEYVAVYDLALGAPANIGVYNAKYAMENSSEKKRLKEITRATVRAQFLPAVVHTWNGSVLTEVANTAALGTTYWTVTTAVGETTKFFYTQSEADAYALANTVSAIKYTDGYNYWSIAFNEKHATQQWDNLRNNMFHCTINKIMTPGNNEDGPKDPEVTPSESTNIFATVNIKFWDTPILSDHDLDKW